MLSKEKSGPVARCELGLTTLFSQEAPGIAHRDRETVDMLVR